MDTRRPGLLLATAMVSILLHYLVELTSASGQQQQLQQQQQQHYQQKMHQYNKQVQQSQHHYNKNYQYQNHQYNKQVQNQHYYNKKYPYYYSKYHYQKTYKPKKYKYIKWPRIRGRCSYASWKINEVNQVMEESKKGNMVILFLLKSNDPFSYNQMQRLNDLADHYRQTDRMITVMALNRRSRSLPAIYRTRFKNIKIYEEPGNQDIYALLRASYRQIIIYDKCGRQQYHFGYPYSWLGYPWVKLAVDNVRKFHENYALCGRCKGPSTSANTTTQSLVTISSTNTTVKTTTLKPTEKSVDGPYTNIPVAAKNV